jgi:hypothetical protein
MLTYLFINLGNEHRKIYDECGFRAFRITGRDIIQDHHVVLVKTRLKEFRSIIKEKDVKI